MRPNTWVYGMQIPHQAHYYKKEEGPFKIIDGETNPAPI